MDENSINKKIQNIIDNCIKLTNKHVSTISLIIDYVCIFSHSEDEFKSLLTTTKQIGSTVKQTSTGPIIEIKPITTNAGTLKLLKIRKPFANKPQLGYADFKLTNYESFKKKYLSNEYFTLTKRETYEILGIKDPDFNVITYFAHPSISEQLFNNQDKEK